MQKKLKAKEWSLVYEHVRPRLQHEGKKKLRKPTKFLINGTQKHWNDVWKEIRRNYARNQGPRRGLCKNCLQNLVPSPPNTRDPGPIPPLPHGIVIRTPSPELLETTVRERQSKSPHYLIYQLFQTTLVSLQPLFEWDSQSRSRTETSNEMKKADSVYRLCLEGIPFTVFLEKITGTKSSSFELVPRNVLTSPRYRTRSLTISSCRCCAWEKRR